VIIVAQAILRRVGMKECWSYYESGTAEGEAPRSSDGIRFFEPLGELVGVMI
jgi:hypothetical protein